MLCSTCKRKRCYFRKDYGQSLITRSQREDTQIPKFQLELGFGTYWTVHLSSGPRVEELREYTQRQARARSPTPEVKSREKRGIATPVTKTFIKDTFQPYLCRLLPFPFLK